MDCETNFFDTSIRKGLKTQRKDARDSLKSYLEDLKIEKARLNKLKSLSTANIPCNYIEERIENLKILIINTRKKRLQLGQRIRQLRKMPEELNQKLVQAAMTFYYCSIISNRGKETCIEFQSSIRKSGGIIAEEINRLNEIASSYEKMQRQVKENAAPKTDIR